MSGEAKKLVRRPFHETIVDAIRETDSDEGFRTLARLIMTTEILKGHDNIIVAWKERFLDIDIVDINDGDINVAAFVDLLEQKKETEAGAKVKEQAPGT